MEQVKIFQGRPKDIENEANKWLVENRTCSVLSMNVSVGGYADQTTILIHYRVSK